MRTEQIDLSSASVSCSVAEKPGPKAVRMLIDEVRRRTGITPRRHRAGKDASGSHVISLETVDKPWLGRAILPSAAQRGPPEGYSIQADPEKASVTVIGNDPRGLLFGVGRLLRVLNYAEQSVSAPLPLAIRSHPPFAMRGHQLGYRPRSNTYDSWDIDQYEQYIRDLVAWGANTVELIAPVASADVITHPGFAEKAWKMAISLSKLLDSYDIDVHVWMPVDDRALTGREVEGLKAGEFLCPSTPAGRKAILQARAKFFRAMRRIDAVFIPGGDPGGCVCERCRPWAMTLIPLAEEIGSLLARQHPNAKVWLSNQNFSRKENEYFYSFLETNPDWLGGVVYGPWVSETIQEARRRVPRRFSLRNYPDICHSLRCQYPVPEWDHAYALIEGREPPNPRPADEAHIHNLFCQYFCGTVTYSDGVNDDVNKIIWSALDWDPSCKVEDVLVEYARYLIGGGMERMIAEGILALEKNWRGSLVENESVEETLAMWQRIDRQASPSVRRNWRFQLLLFRAYLDCYVRRKLLAERELEDRARETLSNAATIGSEKALRASLEILSRSGKDLALRQRVEQLARSLHERIGMKLGRIFGAEPERADILDFLDEPLNNSEWMVSEINSLLATRNEEMQIRGIRRVLEWEDAGAGGFYDDLGNPQRQPHLVRRLTWGEDPGGLRTATQEFDFQLLKGGRLSWRRQASTFWGTPLEMHYDGLDPNSKYCLRVTYGGYRHRIRFRLDTGRGLQIHGPIEMPRTPVQLDFELPEDETRGGELDLRWSLVGEGRGLAVAEVWLFKR